MHDKRGANIDLQRDHHQGGPTVSDFVDFYNLFAEWLRLPKRVHVIYTDFSKTSDSSIASRNFSPTIIEWLAYYHIWGSLSPSVEGLKALY